MSAAPEPFYACEGKVTFSRRDEATFCKRISEEKAGGDSYHVYWCGRCHGWHVGHADLFRRRKFARGG